jgi:hypothetical protein
VTDVEAARTELIDGGVAVSEVFHDTGGVFHHAGTAERAPGPAPDHKSYGSFVSFRDPDGNGWFSKRSRPGCPADEGTRTGWLEYEPAGQPAPTEEVAWPCPRPLIL